jgi:hypothetical protein
MAGKSERAADAFAAAFSVDGDSDDDVVEAGKAGRAQAGLTPGSPRDCSLRQGREEERKALCQEGEREGGREREERPPGCTQR